MSKQAPFPGLKHSRGKSTVAVKGACSRGSTGRLVHPLLLTIACLLIAASAEAAPGQAPKRQLPQAVVAQVRLMENAFRRALAQDCAPERCFAKACVHVAHTKVDRSEGSSLPGLNLAPPPGLGDAPAQVHLTTVECSFAHDPSVLPKDAAALAKRLQSKLSRAWTEVDIVYEKLPPVRKSLSKSPLPDPEPQYPYRQPPPRPEPEPEAESKAEEDTEQPVAETPPPSWAQTEPSRELWLSLLPHFAWMFGLFLLTLAGLVVIWALRRLGRVSPEEQLLLAQLAKEGEEEGARSEGAPGASAAEEDPHHARWRERLAKATRSGEADPALSALVGDLLRSGEYAMLAKAVQLFPEEFSMAFPNDGRLASARFAFAEHLKSRGASSVPGDNTFFEKLDRYAISAQLTADVDADLMRGLHEDFGPNALIQALDVVPERYGALLFAHASGVVQHEAATMMSQQQLGRAADWLMRSNRIDPVETNYLLKVLSALREGIDLPQAPLEGSVSDRGNEFNAASALSVLLPRLSTDERQRLVDGAVKRSGGKLPNWMRSTLYGEMLLQVEPSQRNDLLLQVNTAELAAWLQTQGRDAKQSLLLEAPSPLQAALSATQLPSTPQELHGLAAAGSNTLSVGLLRQLAPDFTFHSLLR